MNCCSQPKFPRARKNLCTMPVNPLIVHNGTVIAERLNVVATCTMTKATFESGKICRQRRRSSREKKMAKVRSKESTSCTQILTTSNKTEVLRQTPFLHSSTNIIDCALSRRAPFKCVKSLSITCPVRTLSDTVSSIPALLDSAAMPAPVKATTTRSLPTNQSILLYGAVLVSASVTIPFGPSTDSMWASFTPKLNAGGGPTVASNRP